MLAMRNTGFSMSPRRPEREIRRLLRRGRLLFALAVPFGCASARAMHSQAEASLCGGDRARVPAIPPDSEPAWFADDTSWAGAEHDGYLKRVVAVLFRPEATQNEKQLAIDAVCGTVVGGTRVGETWGAYYVQIEDDGKGTQLGQAIRMVKAMPQVREAFFNYRGEPGDD